MLALTGTDPDRLQEEKTQGITIEFGCVHAVEDGVALSVVDVPGHERFVRNMLAGVGVMDLGMWSAEPVSKVHRCQSGC